MKKLFLSIILLLSIVALFADGVHPEGTGDENDPYRIETLDNLLWLSTTEDVWNDNAYYIQTSNINAIETQDWNNGEGFSPIGTNQYNLFSGYYDGQNYSINHLYIDRREQNNQGLFGYTSSTEIHNLNLINLNITGYEFTGGFIGRAINSSKTQNCSGTGFLSGWCDLGGIVGWADNNFTAINCRNESTITCFYDQNVCGNAGGIIGSSHNYSVVEDCVNFGNISTLWHAGGIIGIIDDGALVTNCDSECNVNATAQYAGGIVGLAFVDLSLSNSSFIGSLGSGDKIGGIVGACSGSTIENSFCLVQVTGLDMLGGVVGQLFGSTLSCCYSIGDIDGADEENYCYGEVGGLAGEALAGTINNCFSGCNVIGIRSVGGLVGRSLTNSLINNCFSYGAIQGNSFVGGLIGEEASNCVTYSSFWDINTSGQTESAGEETGKTTIEMKNAFTYTNLESEGLNIAWDFINNPYDDIENNDYWAIDLSINHGYPHLRNLDVSFLAATTELTPTKQTISITNYPNPFNPSTTIEFSIQNNFRIELSIYNIKGQKIKTLAQNEFTEGSHTIIWNGNDAFGKPASSGVYFYKLVADGETIAVQKMMLIK